MQAEEKLVIRAVFSWAASAVLGVLALLFLGVGYLFLVLFLSKMALNLVQFSHRIRAAFAGQTLADRYEESLTRSRRSPFFWIYVVLRFGWTGFLLAASIYFLAQPLGRVGLLRF